MELMISWLSNSSFTSSSKTNTLRCLSLFRMASRVSMVLSTSILPILVSSTVKSQAKCASMTESQVSPLHKNRSLWFIQKTGSRILALSVAKTVINHSLVTICMLQRIRRSNLPFHSSSMSKRTNSLRKFVLRNKKLKVKTRPNFQKSKLLIKVLNLAYPKSLMLLPI